MQQLDEILQAGNFDDEFNFDFFTGVACLNLGGSVSNQLNTILNLTSSLSTRIYGSDPEIREGELMMVSL